MGERVVHRVPPEASGLRLDHFLSERHQELSRSRLQALVDEGHVLVDGRRVKPSRKLRGGEEVSVEVPAPVPAEPQPEELPLEILHEDPDLLVVNKAAGMVVHPAAGVDSGTLVNAILFHVRDLQGIGGEIRPGIVHRLDKDTSGCMVVAKNDLALARLQQAFKQRVVDKRYLALVYGDPPEAWTMDTPFGRHPTDRVRFTSQRPVGPQRQALSHFRVLERFGLAALVEAEIVTGRTHQIRVHLSEAGHPLLADELYGRSLRKTRRKENPLARRAEAAIGRQALHAHSLTFPHPSSGETMRFEARLPEDFEGALAVLRAYTRAP